ncbi:MAG: adenylyl-sulfate kinase [Rikenellaceae bacterium]
MNKLEIHPVFDKMLLREDREKLLNQRSVMIWFTGLSGSGKSTLSIALEKELHARGFLCRLLDGDNIRSGINKNLTFSEEDRLENIRRIAEVSKLFVDSGVITIAAFISPTDAIRDMAKKIIGEENFMEVFVSTPIEVCEQRDIKGLYEKARRGEIKEFTGISSPFDAPQNPTLSIDTSKLKLEESVAMLLKIVLPRITISNNK